MPIHEQIENYTVSILRNNVVNYGYIVRLSLTSGHSVSITFPKEPATDSLVITGDTTRVQFPERQFAEIRQLLQTESPVFFTALKLLGLWTVNLTSDPEPTGEGFHDGDAASLIELLASSGKQAPVTD